MDLRPTCEAGSDRIPERIERDLFLQLRGEFRPLRPWTDQAHLAAQNIEELWQLIGKPYSIHSQPWPEVDEDAAAEDTIHLIIQVNGKLRDRIQVPANISAEDAESIALNNDIVQRYLSGKAPRRVIYVPGRLVNIVL